MKIPIKHILLEDEIILEISALKARQMSLKAGIIPDHNTNWKGALKKVRGARGELTSGKELNQIKQKMGFPENNVLQKLKSAENKVRNGYEVGYNNKTKKIINGLDGRIDPGDGIYKTNKYQVGFIHTHPFVEKNLKKEFNIKNLDSPSGFRFRNNRNYKKIHSIEMVDGDIKEFKAAKHIKFPIYAPSENTVSTTRIYNKQSNPNFISNLYKKMDQVDEKYSQIENDYNNLSNKKTLTALELKNDLKKAAYEYDQHLKKINPYKMNHIRFIVGKENYDKFNLNGEKIK